MTSNIVDSSAVCSRVAVTSNVPRPPIANRDASVIVVPGGTVTRCVERSSIRPARMPATTR